MADTIVIFESPTITQDTNIAGGVTDSMLVLATALIATGNPLDKTRLIEVQLEYECEEGQKLWFQYSEDAGGNWSHYSSVNIEETSGPTILAIRKTIVGHNMQLRIMAESIGKLRVLSFVPRVIREGRVRS